MATAHQPPITTIAIGADGVNVALGHVLFDDLPAFLVVFDELMPATSGAVFDASTKAGNDNPVTIWGGPSIFDPANFPNFSNSAPFLGHTEATSCFWEGVSSLSDAFGQVNGATNPAKLTTCCMGVTSFDGAAA